MVQKPPAIMGKVPVGSAGKYHDRHYPNVDEQGRVALSEADGVPSAPVRVHGNIQYRYSLSNAVSDDMATAMKQVADQMRREETVYRLFHGTLVVTDCRIVFTLDKSPEPSTVYTGHIRYPWITSVGFRPKQSFLNECALEVTFQQEMGGAIGGTWLNRVDFTFAPSVDSGAIALDIAHRLARHHLQNDAPESTRAGFEEMMSAPRPANPAKGDFAWFYPPGFMQHPYGAQYLGDGKGDGNWLGPHLS